MGYKLNLMKILQGCLKWNIPKKGIFIGLCTQFNVRLIAPAIHRYRYIRWFPLVSLGMQWRIEMYLHTTNVYEWFWFILINFAYISHNNTLNEWQLIDNPTICLKLHELGCTYEPFLAQQLCLGKESVFNSIAYIKYWSALNKTAAIVF